MANNADDEEPQTKKIKLANVENIQNSPPDIETETTNETAHFPSEADVGITEYMSDGPGFSGILKQRYSDFIVNEIDTNGEVIRLTDNTLPPPCLPKPVEIAADVLSEDDQVKLRSLVTSDDLQSEVILQAGNDKRQRTTVHAAIRSILPDLESNTEDRDGVKVICVTRKKRGLWENDRRKNAWPRERPDYLQFTLYKENKDTMDTVDLVAKQLRVKSSLFTYSGTKDRRAKTSQLVTAFRITAERLVGVEKSLCNIAFGNFKYVKKPLKLGQLMGNHFTVILRNALGSTDDITAALTSLKLHGFINYFGMQRFGTSTIPTHHIGRALLCSRWEEAVDLILKPRPGDKPEMVECRKIWATTRNAKQALEKVGRRSNIERSLLTGLVKLGDTNYSNAINVISRYTRLMYVHSYQSYAWNTVTSRRLSLLGHAPVVGDLVLKSTLNAGKDALPQHVTESTLTNYTILDVVLPLPGHSIIYPNNQVRDWFKDILAADDLDIDHMAHRNRDYSLPGSYRHVVSSVNDLDWSLVHYSDHTVPLAHSDYDLLHNDPRATPDEGDLLALRIDFSLAPSTYATMALREVLRADTSPNHQSSLNVT